MKQAGDEEAAALRDGEMPKPVNGGTEEER
jgi:hypothetical protein